jgi:Ca2+-binding RTX toxin-like protein
MVAPIIDSQALQDVGFLLSVAGALPKLVAFTVLPQTLIDPDGTADSGDEYKIISKEDLLSQLQAALDAAFGSGVVTATDTDNDGFIELSAAGTLEITNTLTMGAINNITYAEWTIASNKDLFEATPDMAHNQFDLVLDLDPRAGINFTPAGDPQLEVHLKPFTDAIEIVVDDSGIERFNLPLELTDFDQYLDFNVIGPGEIIGLVTQLAGWLDRLPGTYMLGNFSIPFAKAVLGDILDFGDLVEDTLLINDGDDGIQPADRLGAGLLKFVDDPNSLTIAFGTAQELTARLKDINVLKEIGGKDTGIWADYDEDPASETYRQLFYHLTLEHTLLPDTAGNTAIVPVDFSLNLEPLNNIYSGSKVALGAYGFFEAIVGIAMGDARTIDLSAKLEDLRTASGKTVLDSINQGLALTGAEDVSVIFGRLTADQSFGVSITVVGMTDPIAKTVTVTKAVTDLNTTLQDLVDDINAAIEAVVASGEEGSEVYLDKYIKAGLIDNRIQLFANNDLVQSFEITSRSQVTSGFDLGIIADGGIFQATKSLVQIALSSQLGLEPGFASTVQMAAASPLGSGSVTIPGGVTFKISINSEASVDVTVPQDNNNLTLNDVIQDINAKIADKEAIADKIRAAQADGKIVFLAIDKSVEFLQIEVVGSKTKLGFSPFVAGVADAAPSNGQLLADQTIYIDIWNQFFGYSAPRTIIVTADSTQTNNNVDDLVKDINNAILSQPTLVNLIRAERGVGDTIVLRGLGVVEFKVAAPAGNELGLAEGSIVNDGTFDEIDGGQTSIVSQTAGVFLRSEADVLSQKGRLTDDAVFNISLNEGTAIEVKVPYDDTRFNGSVAELVADINRAIDAKSELKGMIRAELSGNFRIVLRAIDSSVASFTLTADADDPAVKEMGFGTSQTAEAVLNATAKKDAPSYVGISGDAAFTVWVTTGLGTVEKPVTLTMLDTMTNRSIFDMVSDLNRALNAAFGGAEENPLLASNDGNRLIIRPKEGSGVTNFSVVSHVENAAIKDLKLYDVRATLPGSGNVGFQANSWDLLIQTWDGVIRSVTLDDAETISDVINAIKTQTGGKVDAVINRAQTGLDLIDKSISYATPPAPMFRVDAVNGSGAALALGIFAADTNSVSEARDGRIEGQGISPLKLADRLYLREVLDENTTENLTDTIPIFRANFTIKSDLPATADVEQIEAVGNFGFVGVELTGGGTIGAFFEMGLEDSGPQGTMLSDLIRAVSQDKDGDGDVDVFDLRQYVKYPTVTYNSSFNSLSFDVKIADLPDGTPLDEITLGASPKIIPTIVYPAFPFYYPAGMNTPFNPAAAVDLGADTISLTGHKLKTGDVVSYRNGPGGADIGGLVNGNSYYVINVDADTIKLASTAAKAKAGAAIDLISFGEGTAHKLEGFQPLAPTMAVLHSDIGALENFKDITFDEFLAALKGLNDFLQKYAALSFLGEELPLIGVSVNDLVGIAERFNLAVVEIEKNKAGSIQLVEQKIRETFGLPQGADVFDLKLVDNGNGDADVKDLLKITLNLSKAFNQPLPVNIDLTELLPDELDLEALRLLGSAGLGVSGYLNAKLSFGVDLDNNSMIYLFTNEADTVIEGQLTASADNLAFNAALGSLGVYIKEGNADFSLNFGFQTTDGADAKRAIGIAFDAFDASLTGSAEATLPVFYPSQSSFKGDIDLTSSFSLSGNSLATTIDLDADPDLFTLDFSSFNLFDNIALMIDAADLFLMGLQDILDGQVFGFSLPIVGDKLSAGADFIEDFRLDFIQPLQKLVEDAPEKAEEIITNFLFTTLMSTGLLLDLDGSELEGDEVAYDVIQVTKNLDSGDSIIDFAQWNFVLGQTFKPKVDFDFDLGFPALGLDADIELDVDFSWSLGLGFGISLDKGAYIDVGRKDASDALIPELEVGVSAVLKDSSNLSGRLLFLELVIDGASGEFTQKVELEKDYEDITPSDATQFFASFSVDLKNTVDESDTRLGYSELGNLGFGMEFKADAEVNLDLRVQFNDDILPNTISALLPALEATFVLDWQVETTFTGDFDLADGLKYVAFLDVELDLGSFLGELVVPIVEKIQEVTEPLQPIVDFVAARIPVLSDLAGRKITLIDLAAAFGEINPDLIYAIADIISFVNSIPTNINSLMILIADEFVIFGSGIGVTAKQLTDPNFKIADNVDDSVFSSGAAQQLFDEAGKFIGGTLLGDSDTGKAMKGLLGGDYNTETDNGKYGFAFPILEDLGQVLGLLVGKPAVLITYDLPPFFMDFTLELSFPIYPPLYAVVSAGVGLQIDFAFGYDTKGIQDFIEGGASNPLDLLSGLFISDTDNPDGSFGTDVPELKLWGGIGVGAELNLGIASAGAMADITITFNFDLYDPDRDGKVRITELVNTFLHEVRSGNADAPLSIFDISGDIAFQLSAYIEIFFAKFDFEITPRIVIWEFDIPFERTPILATERGDGALLLNIGPNAGSRLNGNTNDIAETIYAKDAGSGKVAVWGMGVEESAAQIYKANKIIAYGGEGNDVIDLSRVSVPVEVYGGSGNDVIKGGSKNDVLRGGVGDDTIEGGGGDDRIWGDEGNDTIHGGTGKDIIFGDGGTIGSDRITALGGSKDGNDTIYGDGDEDVIIGGGGDDKIYGGDNAGGADGGDLLFGDSARIELIGGALPKLSGGEYDLSKISARGLVGGNDLIFGNAGNDTIFGGKGDDIIDGGADDDVLYGNEGFDTIYGGGGEDLIYGGTEDDRIFGGRDDLVPADKRDVTDATDDLKDVIYGEDGNDFIRGNLGDDLIYGGRGADIIFGDEDDDEIYGGSDPDFIFGRGGDDYIEGQTGNDYIFGDDGIIVYVDFYGSGLHKLIGLFEGVPDIHKVTDLELTAISGTGDILTTHDEKRRTLDLLLTLVNGVTDGNDEIIGGEGDDIVFGGAKDDIIFGDLDPSKSLVGPVPAGEDILIGDGGRVHFYGRRLFNVQTVVATTVDETGVDTISGNGGNDLIFGGGGGDFLYGRMHPDRTGPNEDLSVVTDNDIIIGDDGEIQYTAGTGIIVSIATTITPNAIDTGGVDTIYGNRGDDIIFGGMDGDELYGNEGDDIILGDNGRIDFTGGVISRISTTDTSEDSGGPDTIYGQEGDDIILGGVNKGGVDTIFGNTGNDIILGDNGLLDFAFAGDTDLTTLDLIRSFIDGWGGKDIISGNAGEDTILGGTGGDTIYGDDETASAGALDGQDILLGDNGDIFLSGDVASRLKILDSAVRLIKTTDADNGTGGIDTIEGNAKGDIILGGAAGDFIYGDQQTTTTASINHDGNDVILGDNGELDFAFGGDTDLMTLDLIRSYPGVVGGADTISGNKGDDTIIGGTAGDTIYGDNAGITAGSLDGEDVILGDNGDIFLSGDVASRLKILDSAVRLIKTTDADNGTGGIDTIEGNAKGDIILGGAAGDSIYGDRQTTTTASINHDGNDVILGDNGELDFAFGGDTDLMTLDLIRSYPGVVGGADTISGNKGDDTIIGGTAGDMIYGDDETATAAGADLDDILIGDNADIFLIGTVGQRIVLGTAVDRIVTTDDEEATGGADLIEGNAGADIIIGGVNNDGQDDLYGDAASPVGYLDGNDIILGDNAELDWTFNDEDRTTLDLIATITYAGNGTTVLGSRDNIFGNAGDDIILGGSGGDLIIGDNDESSDSKTPGAADTLETHAGADILIGDQGRLVYENGLIALIETTDLKETDGGIDYIEGNDFGDIILGGVGGDILIGESQYGNSAQQGADYVGTPGADIIIGDQGRLRYNVAAGEQLVHDDATGKVDENYAFGDGDPETLDLIETFKTGNTSGDPEGALGGADWIFGNEGADIVMGGTNGDFIYGDFYAALKLGNAWSLSVDGVTPARAPFPGEDVLIGDGGQITYHDEMVTMIRSIEPGHGGSDMIQGNDLSDIIMGGFDGDLLYGEADPANLGLIDGRAGDDVILGDNGRMDWILVSDDILGRQDVIDYLDDNGSKTVALDNDPLTLDRITTSDPSLGGNDVIYGNGNRIENAGDLIFGGTGSDTIYGDTSDVGAGVDGPDGKDLAFGDHGKIYPTLPGVDPFFVNNNFFSIHTNQADLGNGDVIFGNANDDILIGGQGDDIVFGGTGDDDLIGGHNISGSQDPDDGESAHDDMDEMDEASRWAIDPRFLADLNPADVNEINDILDGGAGDDVIAGDNAIIIRQPNYMVEGILSPRFRMVGDGGQGYTLISQRVGGLADIDVGFEANVTDAWQPHQDMTLVRTVTLLDHSEQIEDAAVGNPTAPRPFGNDIIAGGTEDDEIFGQLGDDIIQGDGEIEVIIHAKDLTAFDLYNPAQDADPSFDLRNFTIQVDLDTDNDTLATLRFNVFEQFADGDDYIEGNGGNDRIYGNLGQDDIIGGSSTLFGLGDGDAGFQGVDRGVDLRPDGADLIYGGAGNVDLLARNATVEGSDTLVPVEERHATDADTILGDNGDIYRVVIDSGAGGIVYDSFNYDGDATVADGFVDDGYGMDALKIRPRLVNFADYGYFYVDHDGDPGTREVLRFTPDARGEGDLIYGESGDDVIHGMVGNDAIFGGSEHDDLYGEIGSDYLLGGTGIDGILGDDGLILTSRNDLNPEPLHGIDALNPQQVFLKKNDPVDTKALNAVITTPGDIQIAIINVENELVKAVELFAFRTDDMDASHIGEFDDSMRWNDIIFGGWDSDFIHGGDGDDAISGAEALPAYYSAEGFGFTDLNTFLQAMQNAPPNNVPDLADNPFWFDFAPYNPGDILRYEGKTIIDGNGQNAKTRQEFAWYDEFHPRKKIMFDFDNVEVLETIDDFTRTAIDFILNFDAFEGPLGPTFDGEDRLPTDGADRIFGDLGNDWLVGGAGRDHMYGGRGDDLINMDDNHDSGAREFNAKPKQTPGDSLENTLSDEYQAYADIVYSGAGRDIMILNTGADRATDWVGEYNSYIVPFSPFGAFHISRTLQPQLPEFLQALSDSDGIDNRVDANKLNNVVDAQLYVDQKMLDVRTDDPDPMRAGEPYGELGMVRQTDYDWQEQTGAPNDPQPGNLQGKREIMRRELFSYTLETTAFAADVGTLSVSSGVLTVTPDELGGESVGLYFLDMVQPGYMEVLATVNMGKPTAGVKSNGFIIFDYQSPTDFKFAGIDNSIDKIQIGHRTASGWIVDVQIPMQLRERINYNLTLVMYGSVATIWVDQKYSLSFDFKEALNDDGMIGLGTNGAITKFDNWQVQKLPPNFTLIETADFSTTQPFTWTMGDWSQPNGVFTGTTDVGDHALAVRGLDVGAYTRLEFDAVLQTMTTGGLVFDYYNADDFKFAAVVPDSDKVIIGHHKDGKWFIDTEVSLALDSGIYSTLTVSLFGTQSVMASAAPAVQADAASWLTYDQLDAIVDEAKDRWAASLGGNVIGQAALDQVTFQIVNFGDLTLGRTMGSTVLIDLDAAGWGWFVDETPGDDLEFGQSLSDLEKVALETSPAFGRMDLLTVVMHEFGHVLGLKDLDPRTPWD